jgi:hypothetical protein
MQISFQAPRFDAAGKKIANAKVISIRLNGYVLHENVELTYPTGIQSLKMKLHLIHL